ncbi:MAG: autotransporter-associated beta strand repeat-containing protein, partial [Verrucomicrobiae bacterium]|nr:autotransporter-associated beta strand repeat-containing protein [Verrucomicrobiae bacterium]
FQTGSDAYDIRLTTGVTSTTAANLTFNNVNTGITVEAGDNSSHTIGIFGGNVILQGNLAVAHNGSGTLTINQPITGSGFGVTKTGTGLMKLDGANTYSGATQINGGILSFGSLAAYGSTSGVSVGASGTVGLGVGSTGTTTHYEFADLVSLFNTNSLAGFSLNAASGVAIDTSASSFSVLNQSGAGPDAALTGTRSLTKIGTKTLQLNVTNTYTGATIIKEGGLNVGAGLNGGKLSPDSTITVESGASFGVNLQRNAAQGTDFSSAPITGGGGFEQIGSGITTLNAANSYSGTTTVAGGMLKYEGSASLALTSGNLIVGGGGVVGLSENLTRDRGTGSNQIQWNGSGGFAAIGADRTVSLDGGGNVQWNSGNFVPAGGSLILGHEAATHTVIFTNNINFAGGSRTIEVGDGAAAIDAVVSG